MSKASDKLKEIVEGKKLVGKEYRDSIGYLSQDHADLLNNIKDVQKFVDSFVGDEFGGPDPDIARPKKIAAVYDAARKLVSACKDASTMKTKDWD